MHVKNYFDEDEEIILMQMKNIFDENEMKTIKVN